MKLSVDVSELFNETDVQAGVNGSAAALDTDPAQLAAMFDVNVVGPLRMVQAFAPALAKTTTTSAKRSKIVNIGTVMSGGAPWHTGYASTKVSSPSISWTGTRQVELMNRQHYSL